MLTCISAAPGLSEIAACLPAPLADRPSAVLPASSSPLQAVTLLSSSLDASSPCIPAVVLHSCIFQAAVL